MKRTLKNTNMKPLNHSTYARLQVLCGSFYDVDEKFQALDQLSITDLNAFIPELRSQVYILRISNHLMQHVTHIV